MPSSHSTTVTRRPMPGRFAPREAASPAPTAPAGGRPRISTFSGIAKLLVQACPPPRRPTRLPETPSSASATAVTAGTIAAGS